jgi:hypothetical protein
LYGRKSGIKVRRSLAYCNDVPGLLDYLKEHRSLGNLSCHHKVGIDGGGGFLKVCLNVEKVDENIPEEKKPQFSFSEVAFSSDFKDSSVNKLIILAIVEDVYENYNNLK